MAVILAVTQFAGRRRPSRGGIGRRRKTRWLRDLASGKTCSARSRCRRPMPEPMRRTSRPPPFETPAATDSTDGRCGWPTASTRASRSSSPPPIRARAGAACRPSSSRSIEPASGASLASTRSACAVSGAWISCSSDVEVSEDERVGAENGGFAIARQALEAGRDRHRRAGARRRSGGARRSDRTRRKRGRPSAGPSRSIRRSSGSSPTWRPSWKPLAC